MMLCKTHFCGRGAEELLAMLRGRPSAGANVFFNPATLCGNTVWLQSAYFGCRILPILSIGLRGISAVSFFWNILKTIEHAKLYVHSLYALLWFF